MSKFALLLLLVIACTSLKVHHNQLISSNPSTGGWSSGPSDPNIDQYIRQQFPYLSGSTLVSAQSQIVSGTNYLYTYQNGNTAWAITVNDQSWANFRQITSVQKTTQWTDQNGNIAQSVISTQLDPRDFTSIVRSKFGQ
jgi:hypothetical protein